MSFAASLLDKEIWGYNTPQDYLHLERLQKHFPQAKFIYLMRDPRLVLRSYKNVQSNGYHETNRYHPILQALAWRTAIRSFLKRKSADNCILVRYEDLTTEPNTELSRIGEFLGTEFHEIDINKFGNNSSFKGKRQKADLTETEIWFCEQIAGEEMKATNYNLSEVKPKLKDLSQISKLTLRASIFYLSKSLLSPNVRKRILQVMKKVITRNKVTT
ncbi:MAG: sulfotransferase [Oscillatoria sp. PMC 1068.18]|nr:sulfotransferase [Oscillatoria sp. PMC 1076.18]MEC4990953.1 sulfotransferase [Oscillatoria sp. PMC 1068.18]